MPSRQAAAVANNAPAARAAGLPNVKFAAAAAGGAAAVGIMAESLQHVAAPWLLFPALHGLLMGAFVSGCCKLFGLERLRWPATTVALAALASCGVQHQTAFWRSRQVQATSPESDLARQAFPAERLRLAPQNVVQFLRGQAQLGRPLPGGWRARGGWAWASWALDAGVAAAVAAITFARFQTRWMQRLAPNKQEASREPGHAG